MMEIIALTLFLLRFFVSCIAVSQCKEAESLLEYENALQKCQVTVSKGQYLENAMVLQQYTSGCMGDRGNNFWRDFFIHRLLATKLGKNFVTSYRFLRLTSLLV